MPTMNTSRSLGAISTGGLSPSGCTSRPMCRRGTLRRVVRWVRYSKSWQMAKRSPAALPLLGEHSIYNALAAVAVGLQYGVSLRDGRRLAGDVISLETSEAKSSTTRARLSLTIATIPIQRPSTAWCGRWPRFPRGAGLWSPARCWNSVPQRKAMHRDCGRHMAGLWNR